MAIAASESASLAYSSVKEASVNAFDHHCMYATSAHKKFLEANGRGLIRRELREIMEVGSSEGKLSPTLFAYYMYKLVLRVKNLR